MEQKQHPGGNSPEGPRKFGSRERSFKKERKAIPNGSENRRLVI